MASPDGPAGLLALQQTAGNRAVQRWLAGRTLQRKEVTVDAEITGSQDWTSWDRVWGTARWKAACLRNLAAVDTDQYRRVVERRDFYKWFYDLTVSKGYTTRWPLAAWLVANGAHQIADMNETHDVANGTLLIAGVELQGYMREGNQVIFENVLPKLKRLLAGGPITGRAALEWDMQTLAEEQTLVQPMYGRMSKTAFDEINYIARKKRFAGLGAWWEDEDVVRAETGKVAGGRVPGFDENDLKAVADRWRYGMRLGNKFTPGGSGFDPSKDAMPSVGGGYASGAEFAAVDWRSHLHFVDAFLDPKGIETGGVGPLKRALAAFGDREKREMLTDSSPDGFKYSKQLGFWGPEGLTEADVRAALPSDPGSSMAVDAFVARFKTEAAKWSSFPVYGLGGGF
jgi:hypothetical protein